MESHLFFLCGDKLASLSLGIKKQHLSMPFFCGSCHRLSNYDLLYPHIFTIHETHDINARSGIQAFADTAADLFATKDTTLHINDLQDSRAFIVDNPIAGAEERKVVDVVGIPANEHQLETIVHVRDIGLKSIARCYKQVDICIHEVVD